MASSNTTPTPASETTDEMMKNAPEKKDSTDPMTSNSGSDNPPPPMRKLSRSQSITTSAIPTNFFLPPDVEDQWRKRRESLDNLNLDKVAPWMHLHDFTEAEGQQGASSPVHSS